MKAITKEAFARDNDLHIATVYRLCAGLNFPSSATLKRIKKATGDMVRADDFDNAREAAKRERQRAARSNAKEEAQ